MLAADKDRLVAGLKQRALELRHKELDYYVERYSNITTQASILAGFAFDSLVELEIPEPMYDKRAAVVTVYYVSASCTMAFALYTVCVSSFATVYGHRLALQGPTGSVDRAVAVMMKQRNAIFVTFGIAMFCLVLAAVAMAWLKMDFARCDHAGKCEVGDGSTPGAITGIFVLFFLALVWKHQDMKGLFNIPRERMVQGDVRLAAVRVDKIAPETLSPNLGPGRVLGALCTAEGCPSTRDDGSRSACPACAETRREPCGTLLCRPSRWPPRMSSTARSSRRASDRTTTRPCRSPRPRPPRAARTPARAPPRRRRPSATARRPCTSSIRTAGRAALPAAAACRPSPRSRARRSSRRQCDSRGGEGRWGPHKKLYYKKRRLRERARVLYPVSDPRLEFSIARRRGCTASLALARLARRACRLARSTRYRTRHARSAAPLKFRASSPFAEPRRRGGAARSPAAAALLYGPRPPLLEAGRPLGHA